MSNSAYKGVVRGGNVVFEGLAEPPEGAEVLVTERGAKKDSLQTVLATVEAPPYINSKGLDKLMRFIENMRGNLP